jgi:transketolase
MKTDLSKYIDHTLLRADAKASDIARLCREAKEHGFKSVCVNPSRVGFVAEQLEGSDVLPCCVIGFPLGATLPEVKAFEAAAAIEGPVFIRTARLATPVYDPRPFTPGKGVVIRDGKDCVIFTCGIMLEHTMEAAEILASRGIDAALVSFHTLKPFDDTLACEYTARCGGKVFTVEEHSIIGGLGDAVASAIIGKGVVSFEKIGINDEFGQSGKPADLLKEYGLTGPQIADRIQAGL